MINTPANNVHFNENLVNPQILKGIKIFEGLSLNDVNFIRTKLETINLFRGCNLKCSHCLKNAQAPLAHNKTVLYEDLLELTDGFKVLSERAGENVLKGTRYLSIAEDSNPLDVQINGVSGQHSVAEAMKLIYEKLRVPALFVTAGWNPDSNYAQKTAREIIKMVLRNPDSVADVEISLNPFMGILNKARAALQAGKKDVADKLRNSYVERMANAIATFADLFKTDKAHLIYRHADGNIEGVNALEMKKLYIEIIEKFKKILGLKTNPIPQLSVEEVTRFDPSHLIESSGRARQYFSEKFNFKEQSELIEDALKWSRLSQEQKMTVLKDASLKGIDINGRVYAKFPSSAAYVYSPIELTTETPIRLNYQNHKDTNPLFSDIEIK